MLCCFKYVILLLLTRLQLSCVLAAVEVESRSVIIAGGGMAGLAAARTLANESALEVTVVEANKDRFGGRIWSYQVPGFPGMPVELGALWLRGGTDKRHPIAELCRRFGIELVRNDPSDPDMAINFNTEGIELSSADIDVVEEFRSIIRESRMKMQAMKKPDLPILTAVRQRNSKQYERLMKNTTFRHCGIPFLEQRYGASLDNISILYSEGRTEDKDADTVELRTSGDAVAPIGYSTILDKLVSHGRPFHLLMGHRVTEINLDGNRVQVVTNSTTGSRLALTADLVILALPLGVLQAGLISFNPSLPDTHRAAIQRIGFGNLVKALLVFDQSFWPSKEWFGCGTKAPSGFPAGFVNINKINGLPALLALITGEAADTADRMSSPQIFRKLFSSLEVLFGDIVHQRILKHFKVTRWKTDGLFGGVFSFAKYGMRGDDWLAVQRPPFPNMLLAGEFIEFPENMQGTVAGAYASGVRAARTALAWSERQSAAAGRRRLQPLFLPAFGLVQLLMACL